MTGVKQGCKPGASMSGGARHWLQILKTNYNDKIPPFGGLIELSGFIRKRDTKF